APSIPLYHEQAIPTLARLVDAIHAAGAVVSIQLWHGGRQLHVSGSDTVPVAPSAIAWSRGSGVPRELSVQEIEELIEKFARAAVRAQKAGVDFVEIHGAHGYLVSEFFSPQSNQRNDGYGGDIAGRARFAVEIIRRIKEKAGEHFPVSCRMNGADNVTGGLELDDARAIAQTLESAGLDLISISAGVYGSCPTIVPYVDAPNGCNVPLAEGVKSAVNIPVIAAGRINDPRLAEEILATGKADLVGMFRALVTDPELPGKAARGEFEEIRKCIACNTCIDALDLGPIMCTVNAAFGREKELAIVPATRKKKVLVIGSGPAGLEAARVAALRGHEVTLYDKKPHLGGQWLLAAAPPHKQEFIELVNFHTQQLDKLGVTVILDKEVSASLVEGIKPDAVVVATGAVPLELSLPGINHHSVSNAWDVLQGDVETGKSVLVVGGGNVGLETAHFLAGKGSQVTVIEKLKQVGTDMGSTVRWLLLRTLKEYGVTITRSTELKLITPDGVTVYRNGQEEVWSRFDNVVLAVGAQPLNELATALKDVTEELYIIGDAAAPRRAVDAIREGAETGCRI
ncbi:FAD-dependent oxidoreductase, partial [Chloroflexota bacterium]